MFSFITNLFKPKPKKPSKAGLTMMTKKELEKLGRKYGIELDRRQTKDKLIKQIKKACK